MGARTSGAYLASLQDDREMDERGEQVTASDCADGQGVTSSHGRGSMQAQGPAEYASPRDTEFVDDLPKTSGKIRRIELRERERESR